MSEKKKPLSLYPDAELRAKLEGLAERERRSVNAQTLMLLETHPEIVESPATALREVLDRKAAPMVIGVPPEVATRVAEKHIFRPTRCHHNCDIYTYCEVCDG